MNQFSDFIIVKNVPKSIFILNLLKNRLNWRAGDSRTRLSCGRAIRYCPQSPSVIDCSTLALSQCPEKEDLGPAHGEQDLQLHALHNKTQVVGCYSPCGTLSFGQWGEPANQLVN